jgi:hypothetical protein
VNLRRLFSSRHPLIVEALGVVALYLIYSGSRGFTRGGVTVALEHAGKIVQLEQQLHLFRELEVQRWAAGIPGLVGTLGFAYVTLHLSVTGACLFWLHRRSPETFPVVRTTLMLSSLFALAGYLVFPTAPPRLADIGIVDTISSGHVNLNGMAGRFYNPFAAVPSMHIGYSTIVGISIFRRSSRRLLRIGGILYPLFVLLVIVATGNHFLFDAAAGVLVVALSYLVARLICKPPSS